MTSDPFSVASATAETFEPLIGSEFGIRPDEDLPDVTSLKLTAVNSSSRAPDASRPFSLVLEGASDWALEQDTYYFSHSSLGVFPLFIVPISDAAGIRQYQAVFG